MSIPVMLRPPDCPVYTEVGRAANAEVALAMGHLVLTGLLVALRRKAEGAKVALPGVAVLTWTEKTGITAEGPLPAPVVGYVSEPLTD